MHHHSPRPSSRKRVIQQKTLAGFKTDVISSFLVDPDAHDQIVTLCSDAFETNYGEFLQAFGAVTHVLGTLKGIVVSHALWLDRQLLVGGEHVVRAAYVEAVATTPEHRGRGFGSAVMTRLMYEIGCYEMGALATGVPEWYERLGWHRWAGELLVQRGKRVRPAKDEIVMVCAPSGKYPLDLRASLTAAWRRYEVW